MLENSRTGLRKTHPIHICSISAVIAHDILPRFTVKLNHCMDA
jgi:hypothetical protein